MEAVSPALKPADPTLLQALSEIDGPPGHEGPVREALLARLAPEADEVVLDPLGSLALRRGQGGLRVLIDGHLDEVGMVVSQVTEQGFVKFKTAGGIEAPVLVGRRVRIGPNRVPGVVGSKAVHLLERDERERPPKAKGLLIDIGARSREEALGLVEPGQPIVWDTAFERLSARRVKGKAFDNRVGCAIAAETWLAGPYPGIELWAAFSVQEEVGLRGARALGHRLNPDLVIAVEGTSAGDLPDVEPPRHSTALGQGAVLSLMDGTAIPHPRLLRALVETAERRGLPYQFRRLTTAGTNAGAYHLARSGVPAAVISVPCRYIHSQAAMLDLVDYAAARALLGALIERLSKGEISL